MRLRGSVLAFLFLLIAVYSFGAYRLKSRVVLSNKFVFLSDLVEKGSVSKDVYLFPLPSSRTNVNGSDIEAISGIKVEGSSIIIPKRVVFDKALIIDSVLPHLKKKIGSKGSIRLVVRDRIYVPAANNYEVIVDSINIAKNRAIAHITIYGDSIEVYQGNVSLSYYIRVGKDIYPGDIVRVLYKSGMISISLPARAITGGNIGDKIKCRLLINGLIVYGEVEDKNSIILN